MSAIQAAQYGIHAMPGLNKKKSTQGAAEGSYRHILGGFDICNENGIFFPYVDSVKKMFGANGLVRRRLEQGYLRAEYGHPNLSGMDLREKLSRVALIDPKNVCAHFTSISIEPKKDENGKDIVLVYGDITPAGPYADALQKDLDNPNINVAWSVRSFSHPVVYQGRSAIILDDIVTWDYVTEPGIKKACEFTSAVMEGSKLASLEDSFIFTGKDLGFLDQSASMGFTLNHEAESTLRHVRTAYGWEPVRITRMPDFSNWRLK